jgi:hypothetical protein
MHTATSLSRHPRPWDDVLDGAFFRITAALFTPAYTYGTGVLLAANDDDPDTTPTR